jgi:hypothetical protein
MLVYTVVMFVFRLNSSWRLRKTSSMRRCISSVRKSHHWGDIHLRLKRCCCVESWFVTTSVREMFYKQRRRLWGYMVILERGWE